MSDLTPKQRAAAALAELEAAVIAVLSNSDKALRSFEIAEELGLKSSAEDNHRNHLTWQLLARLMKKGLVEKTGDRSPVYSVKKC